MKKFFTIITIICLFLIFSIYIYTKKNVLTVMNVITPAIVQVDLNNNNNIDDDETICLADIETFTMDLNAQKPEFLKDISLMQNEIISLGYLADEFSKNILQYKQVKVKLSGKKDINCRYGEIYTDGNKYSDVLIESGFAGKFNNYNKKQFKKNLEKANKLNLVILNKKSNKYHKLDCEYGVKSSNYTILPQKQIPKGSKACKFCHVKNTKHKSKEQTLINTQFTNGNIKLILTDFTKNLKPNRNCDNECCRIVLDNINSSKQTIDLAIFGWAEIPKIKDALLKAKSRGVKIRLVYDTKNDAKYQYYPETSKLIQLTDTNKNDKSLNKTSRTDYIMHNKFAIFDNQTVITGSMNYSTTGFSGFNANAIVLINSKDIAKLYTAEFNQMISGKFHDEKQQLNLHNKFKFNNSIVEVYFSPYDKPVKRIVSLIDNAQSYVYVPAFIITHNELSNALIRAKKRGIDVKIIIDANNANSYRKKHQLFRDNLIPMKTENYAGRMHSKSIIMDDRFIVTGSMNFSYSGENHNDENLIIIENVELSKFYKNYFMYIWSKIPDIWLTKYARAEGKDSIGSCSDEIDNNFDGKIDKYDVGCQN